jgi:nicotinate-nucleotide--dimethylbenzimidazole phosphoribosyltransferase
VSATVWPDAPEFDRDLGKRLQQAIDQKTKPLGSLGRLEALALQLGLIRNTLTPDLTRPTMIVFAGDHGIANSGVSRFPSEVTVQMVNNFLRGGAAINVFARQHGMQLEVVNSGVCGSFANASPSGREEILVDIPIDTGTRNFLNEPAMTLDQALQAMESGRARVRHHASLGTTVIGFGEMGIANTSSAACLMSRLCHLPIEHCTGRGTGLDDAGLQHKQSVLKRVLERAPAALAPMDVLTEFGGFEIAMMVGAYIEAAAQRMIILVDGFIATAALLVAERLVPGVVRFCVFSHCSDENGHRRMLETLGAHALLALDLRLGEGSGAALAWPLVQSAALMLKEMATFTDAGISGAAS